MTSIVAKGGEKSSSFPSVSVGVHKARCIKVIDLGTQKNEFEGNITWKRQVLVIWETPDQTNETSEPLTISRFYTLSLHEKSNLGIDLTSWRGRPFSETEKKKSIVKDTGINITSPIVGTAYLAPEPGAKKFVEVGQKIKKGQTIMIVEAMKTMNHVPSTQDGTVSEILVKDGQPVEFGQPLISVK